ncbi:putative oxidoreductase YkvO 1 [Colletotrichum chlorophyti]|uniref:Putative oxidoreductase YkvO 1 n=1 Tax=Colletotrichum chlorophyti TaxID=708187 RepID=A0A1Q8RG81_9PEZI|nr:putative oxidoreductase YkvO 1 [Colletotrichum chlorophyti]
MASTVFSAGKAALITGGASGIGLAVAQNCFRRGMKVLIADRDKLLLSEAKKNVGESLLTFEMDVAKMDDWAELKRFVWSELEGRVDFLLLNAGIQPRSSWDEPKAFRAMFDVNFFGVVNGITTMLPILQSQGASTIVITGSKQGITNPPGNPAYNASKAALNSVAEHLSYDLKDNPVNVHLLVPGWTFTGLGGASTSQKPKPAAAWAASDVANYMEEEISKGHFYIICPDNEVTEEMDKKRILWSANDIVHRRPALSRWRDEFKDQVSDWMAKSQVN